MFENITHFFKKFKKSEKLESKSTAKERLHLVLAQDRANISADFLEMMKQEILEVIKKYIDIDEKAIDVRLTNKESEDGSVGAPALYANIPIITIKNEARMLEGSINKEKVAKNKVDEIGENVPETVAEEKDGQKEEVSENAERVIEEALENESDEEIVGKVLEKKNNAGVIEKASEKENSAGGIEEVSENEDNAGVIKKVSEKENNKENTDWIKEEVLERISNGKEIDAGFQKQNKEEIKNRSRNKKNKKYNKIKSNKKYRN